MRRLSLRRLRLPRQPDTAAMLGTRISIANRLRWSFLISSTLPLLIVGTLLLWLNANAQQRSVYNNQIDLASRVERDISRYVEGLNIQIDRFALKVRPTTSQSQLVDFAKDLVDRNYPNIIDLAVLDEQGQERLRIFNLLVVAPSELLSRARDASVQRALNEGVSTYSPIMRNQDGAHTYMLTRPLRNDSNSIVGVLRFQINAEPIAQELAESIRNSQSYPYLVDTATGDILFDDGQPGFTPPVELDRLLSSHFGAELYIGTRGQTVIGATAPVVVNTSKDRTGWSVVVEQPATEAFSSVRNSVLLLALLIILVGLLALFSAFRQSQYFLRPLAALRKGALALGADQLDYRIDALAQDEMGDLAQTFNRMAAHLQESLAQIEKQNERLRRAMALARDIQIGLLPDRPPWNGDEIAVYARSIPAYEVGGDFYSYLAMSEGRAAIAIGDISGKGVGAALLMALTSSAVESHGRQIEHPAQVLTALNNLLAPRLRANHMNAALLFMIIDPYERTLRVANAGMISPVLLSATGHYFIDVGGLPIGSLAGAIYQEQVVHFAPGDSLLLVSDGVLEAHNPDGELFGFERLEETIAEARPDDVREIVERVLARVQKHMGDREQHDDITIVAVRPSILLTNDQLDEEHAVTYAAL